MVAQQSESTWNRMQEAIEQPVEMAREYPMSSMMVVFGVGLGVGILLSQVACSSLHHEPTFSERLSQQIYDAVNQVIPDSVRHQLSRLHS